MFERAKFLKLPLSQRHKKCAELLKTYHELSSWLDLEPLDGSFPQIADRYHEHAKAAHLSLNEPHFLIRTGDRPSTIPFLPHGIYLDNLRSAHNVGSIIRTIEALRLGTLYLSPKTPGLECKKVIDSAMGAHAHVTCVPNCDLASLPGPKIALETIEGAPSLFEFTFPERFTLVLGNEEYGISKDNLRHIDCAVQIPLSGVKNSLNVSNAFAIAAAFIRHRS